MNKPKQLIVLIALLTLVKPIVPASAQEGAKIETVPVLGHSQSVLSVAFSPDGTRVLSGSRERTVKLWDKSTGALIRTFEGHAYVVDSVAFSPDGQRVLSGSEDKTIKLWDAATGAL